MTPSSGSDHYNRRKRDKVVVAFTRLVVVMFAAIVMTFAYTIWQSYEGRVSLRNATVAGCKRSKLDRAANADGWRHAEAARRASGTMTDLATAREYARIARGLEQRSRIDCEAAFPAASLFPSDH